MPSIDTDPLPWAHRVRCSPVALRGALVCLALTAGLALCAYGYVSLADGPAPLVVGAGSDFAAGPIHGTGSATQWFAAPGPIISAVAFRVVPPSSPANLGINVRLLDAQGAILAEASTSLAVATPDGDITVRLAPTQIAAGEEYGIQFSTRRAEGEFLYLDASNFQPVGPGLEINARRIATQAARIRVFEPSGFRSSLRVLLSAARNMPPAAVASVLAIALAVYAGVTITRRLVAAGGGRLVLSLAVLASLAIGVGIPAAVAGWAVG